MLPYFLRRLPLLALFGLSLLGLPAVAGTLTVPAQYPTIQAAINTAANGDTVLIADGTYTGPGNVDIDFGGKNIAVTSQNGAASTTIDCQGSASTNHRGFYLHSGETSAVINGLTIQNGYTNNSSLAFAETGGAILDDAVGVTVSNCVIQNNYSVYGGGIDNYNSTGTISVTGCVFTGNTALNSGGGIFNVNAGSGTIKVTNCAFSSNSATYGGSGLYDAEESSGTVALTNCTFTHNTTSNGSGCVLNSSSGSYTSGLGVGTTTAINTIFYGDNGSELSEDPNSTAPSIITYCDVQGGHAGTGNISSDPLFISGSSPNDLHLSAGSPCLGAGTASGAPTTTLDGRNRPNPPAIGAYEITLIGTQTTLTSSLNPSNSGQSVTFTASVSSSGGQPTGTVTFTIDGAPQMPVPLGGSGGSSGTASYSTASLTGSSHTITASYSGNTSFAPSVSPALTQVIIAPHVSPQYVSPNGNDNNFGTMASPKLTIQAAINVTLNGDTVIVEDGTYMGPGNVDLDFGGRNITVTSQNGAVKTTIDCVNRNGYANHRGFYLHSGETNAVISGFTIQNGYEYGNGGGIYNSNVSVTVQNCILRNNVAVYGGGICNSVQGNEAISVVNCVIIGNTAETYGQGGGMANSCNGGTITVLNCTVTGNTGMTGSNGVPPGSGIYNSNYPSGSGIALVNDILYGDIDGELGGGGGAISYCDIQGGYAGTGNINADPLFVGSPSDLHLSASSPCLGMGTASGAPTTTIDGMTRPNPPSIGAYEAYPVPTRLSVQAVSGTAGQSVSLSATLSQAGGTGLISGKTLAFSVDGAAVGTAVTGGNGTATLTYGIPAGTAVGSHTITASFAGDSGDQAASGTGTLTVSAATATAATQVRFAPRSGYEYRMTGGKFQGSNDGTAYTDLAAITQAPARGVTTTLAFASPASYRYLRYLSPNNGYGNVAEIEFDGGSGSGVAKITGTPFGTSGSYANSGNDFTKAFDGNTGTFFDAPTANGVFAGIDQGVPGIRRGEVHFTPRPGFPSRMVGGKFQGSTDGTAYTDLYTITAQPPDRTSTVVVLPADPKSYRYLRYLSPSGGYGNVAEVSFYSGTGTGAVKLTGTLFGTPGSYANSGNDYTKVFDGNPATFFDAPTGNGDFAGVDQGAP